MMEAENKLDHDDGEQRMQRANYVIHQDKTLGVLVSAVQISAATSSIRLDRRESNQAHQPKGKRGEHIATRR